MIDQTSQFFAILTNVGAAKQANADALGIPWTITHMGVGDANGTDPIPSATQTALINERRRAPLNQLKVDPSNNAIIVAEQIIPEDVGGWWIREIGLYDLDGDLVAIANCAPSFKPLLTQGSGRTQVVRMNLIVSSSSNVQLKIDPSVVLATREYVDSKTVRASQAEAEAGTENSKIMTPLRVFQAIAKVVKQATESAFGWAKVATQALVDAGTDDSAFVTPKKLRWGFAVNFAANGYIMFPSWLGGLVLQWGSFSTVFNSTAATDYMISWPMAFPKAVYTALVQNVGGIDIGSGVNISIYARSLTNGNVRVTKTGVAYTLTFTWIAIGA
ncbi:hypothetical protein D3C77_177540 [compost metagenome]